MVPRDGWAQSDFCRVVTRLGRAETVRPTALVQRLRCSWNTPVTLAIVVRSRCRYGGSDYHSHRAAAPVLWRRRHLDKSRRRDSSALRDHDGPTVRAAPCFRSMECTPG